MGLPASTDMLMRPRGPPASGRRLSNDVEAKRGFIALRSGQKSGLKTRAASHVCGGNGPARSSGGRLGGFRT